MTFALEFLRIDGRFHKPALHTIPADTTPADELGAFLGVMKINVGANIAQMSPGRYAVHLQEVEQVWSVRIVRVGAELEETQEMSAIEEEAVS